MPLIASSESAVGHNDEHGRHDHIACVATIRSARNTRTLHLHRISAGVGAALDGQAPAVDGARAFRLSPKARAQHSDFGWLIIVAPDRFELLLLRKIPGAIEALRSPSGHLGAEGLILPRDGPSDAGEQPRGRLAPARVNVIGNDIATIAPIL
jgi:hypothetical protein